MTDLKMPATTIVPSDCAFYPVFDYIRCVFNLLCVLQINVCFLTYQIFTIHLSFMEEIVLIVFFGSFLMSPIPLPNLVKNYTNRR